MNKLLITLFSLILITAGIYSLWDDRPYLYIDTATGPWSTGFSKLERLEQLKDKIGVNFIDSTSVHSNVSLNFLADPFFITDSTGIHIFTEHVLDSHGDISYFYSPHNDTLVFSYQGVVLDEPFHLSYPQVFKTEGQYFMLPETQRGGGVILYTTDSFPHHWKHHRVLINQSNIKDPTILFHNNKVYIFGTQKDHLYTWSADNLNDSFKMNPKPLLIGTESRPGGRIFEYDGKLLLPIQNNSRGYGTGLSLYEIVFSGSDISLKRFHKLFLKPEPNIPQFSHGMHHLDVQKYKDGYLTVFDGNSLLDDRREISLKIYVKFLYLNLKNEIRKIFE